MPYQKKIAKSRPFQGLIAAEAGVKLPIWQQGILGSLPEISVPDMQLNIDCIKDRGLRRLRG